MNTPFAERRLTSATSLARVSDTNDKASGDMDGKDRGTIGVLGPGAVGGALAVPLALSGARVVCIARPETAEAISRDGLTLDRCGEILHARPEAVAELREPVDVLFVTVKAPTLDDALDRVAAEAGTILPLLNGLEHMDMIRARLGGRVIAASIGRLEAYRDGQNRIVQTTPSPLVTVAEANGGADVLTAAGFDVRIGPGERAVLWEKLARLAPLAAATVVTQRTLGDLRADPQWRATLEQAVAEACEVAAADGVPLNEVAQWEILDTMPASVTTSAARDAAAGRPTELDAIAGAVVRAGRRLGVPTAVLEGLLAEAEEACRARSR
jgi:2-dehydropantoate 2-reductase